MLKTWNFYLYIMSLWSLIACIFYSTLPESPKYLVTRRKYDEAREILIKMYRQNTGKPGESYPVSSSTSQKLFKCTIRKNIIIYLSIFLSRVSEVWETKVMGLSRSLISKKEMIAAQERDAIIRG